MALLYPGKTHAARTQVQGKFLKSGAGADLFWLPVGETNVRSWMELLGREVQAWLGS